MRFDSVCVRLEGLELLLSVVHVPRNFGLRVYAAWHVVFATEGIALQARNDGHGGDA